MTYRVTLNPDGSVPPLLAVDVEAEDVEVDARGDLLLFGGKATYLPPMDGAARRIGDRVLLHAFAAGAWREVALVRSP